MCESLTQAIIIDSIPFDIRAKDLYPMLRIKSKSTLAGRLDTLLKSALTIARPRALYRLASVENIDDNTVAIDNVRFKSRILKVNLNDRRRAFPFVATCGTELDNLAKSVDNSMESFWMETINLLALGAAMEAVKKHIRNRFETGTTSTMNPGSLADWPLNDQYQLFSMLGDPYEKIGVQLNQNAMMVPLKSVSGIEFESGEKFYNCQLCPRENCPGRRAPYNAHLYEMKYQL